MKRFISGMVVGVVLGVGVYWIFTNKVYDEAFLFPEGYEGCAYVVYNIRGTPELKIKDGTIQYPIDNDGLLLTTSPPDFGWENRETSGFHDVRYFYVNDKGEKTREIPESDIGFISLGEYSENGRVQINSLSIPVAIMLKLVMRNPRS